MTAGEPERLPGDEYLTGRLEAELRCAGRCQAVRTHRQVYDYVWGRAVFRCQGCGLEHEVPASWR
jgi:hypothetical protein